MVMSVLKLPILHISPFMYFHCIRNHVFSSIFIKWLHMYLHNAGLILPMYITCVEMVFDRV